MIHEISQVYTFNEQAGMLDSYDDFKEAEFVIEEALECFDTSYLAIKLHLHEDATPKEISRAIVTGHCKLREPIAPVDRFDKGLDILVFTFGALFKLGLGIQDIFKGLGRVMVANLSKLSVGRDEHGKQMKPKNFIGPENDLQKILDER